eukprot:g35888.t1
MRPIFTTDIQSVYTCIPHGDDLKVLRFFLSRRPNWSPSTDTLICLMELVLILNNFSFNSSHFLQTKAVAMGTQMGPRYACLFREYVKQSLFCCYTGTIPYLFLCYIDDCIGAALCSNEELEQFINITSIFHLNLKFTWTISDSSLSFLDLSVFGSDANHFNSPSHTLGDMSILGLPQRHNDTTRKLEEQHLIFHLGKPQPNGLNIEFTSFKISSH